MTAKRMCLVKRVNMRRIFRNGNTDEVKGETDSMSKETPMLTFIVPAYNAEKYMQECLDSLLYQTETDHKVIVVDDGSTDTTGQIASSYAKQYPEMFTYIRQQNQGQGVARNAALELVDTPYITFLDSDDWQDCYFVEKLKAELSKHEDEIDIVFTLPWLYDSVTHEKHEWRDKAILEPLFYPEGGYESTPSIVITKNNPNWWRMYELEVSPCRRVFRTAFLREINYKFSVGVKWEDVWPHFLSIHHAKRCIALKGSGFFYRINTASQTTAGGGSSRLDIAPVFSHVIQTALKEGWTDGEIAYLIATLWEFAKWSITVTNIEYVDSVLDSLHKLFCDIPNRCFEIHRTWFGRKKRDRLILEINLLRSPMYFVLRDYRMRQTINHTVERIKRVVRKFRRR